ncbi:MAG TPA: LuxR C-terminal-related transcriptional regulator [Pirellulales bacterium]|nr:LuxR C-terminal-related transcriptional regulator [Pirellulales bacterium]
MTQAVFGLDALVVDHNDSAPLPRVSFLRCSAEFVCTVAAIVPAECATTAAFDTEEEWLADLDKPGVPTKQCVVVDTTSGTADRVDAMSLLAHLSCRTVPLPLVALVATGDVRSAVKFMRAGAFDVIELGGPEQELVEAVRLALEDREVEGPSAGTAGKLSSGMFELSDAERQLLRLTVAGLVNKEIAYKMGVSLRTVNTRRSALMKKLGVRTRAELIRLAVQSGQF